MAGSAGTGKVRWSGGLRVTPLCDDPTTRGDGAVVARA